jgi:hypothetical protein
MAVNRPGAGVAVIVGKAVRVGASVSTMAEGSGVGREPQAARNRAIKIKIEGCIGERIMTLSSAYYFTPSSSPPGFGKVTGRLRF